MNITKLLFDQKRLILAVAAFFAAAGLYNWGNMPRQEDPDFPFRAGRVVVALPGADAETVERLIVLPLEDELAEIADIKTMSTTIRSGVVIMVLELEDYVYDTDSVWDEVDEAIADAQVEFPVGATEPDANYNLMDLESIIVAVSGSNDLLVLRDAAEDLERRLLAVDGIQRVEITADPGEQITVELDDIAARELGVAPAQVAAAIEQRTSTIPGGTLAVDGRSLVIDTNSDLQSIEDLQMVPVVLADGTTLRLGDVATVRRGAEEPVAEYMRFNGQAAVAVGAIPERGIDVVTLGERVREVVSDYATDAAPLQVDYVAFQPDRVEQRLSDLGRSLLQGIAIVAALLILAMGLRLGMTVSLIIPLVTLTALSLYALCGGVLQQMSVAGLVLALGLLVDNAIVVAERVQYRIDDGEHRLQAAGNAVRELAFPLAAATGTTLASFIPLLMSKGGSGDFTRAIPQLVMLALIISFVFAMTVTPTIASLIFKPSRKANNTPNAFTRWISRAPVKHPFLSIIFALALVIGSIMQAPNVKQQFFPSGDRNQVVFEVELPEGTHVSETNEALTALERELLGHSDVTGVATFVGRSTPSFYYNLITRPNAPNIGQILVTLESGEQVNDMLAWGREFASDNLAGITFVARALEQGPPIAAPVELRFYGDDLGEMWDAANVATTRVRQEPGTVDIRHTLSAGSTTLAIDVVEGATARDGVGRGNVAAAIAGRTLGQPAGDYRADDDTTPIVVRSSAGEDLAVDAIGGIDVWTQRGPLRVDSVANVSTEFSPPTIHRRNGERYVRVLSQLEPGVAFNEVIGAVRTDMEAIAGDYDLRFELGGEAEGSEDANRAIGVAAPLGVMTLLFFLLVQFRSLRKVGIVLMTVPLAAAGVIPGLLIADQPFGFTSLLGVISLIGIVVNNAIILIDFIDVERDRGVSRDEAISSAISVRLRPILLTTLTTIAGLVPLVMSTSTLWPPMASALISGLAASTVLTLLVVPALYRLAFRDKPVRTFDEVAKSWAPSPSTALIVGLVAFALPAVASAQSVSFEDALDMAEERVIVGAADTAVEQRRQAETTADRTAFGPALTASAEYIVRSEEQVIDTPIGPFTVSESSYGQGAVVITQPVVDLSSQRSDRRAARAHTAVAEYDAETVRRDARLEAGLAYVDVLDLDVGIDTTEAYLASLRAQRDRVDALVAGDRALRSDLLRIEVAVADAEQQLVELRNLREVATLQLGRLAGQEMPVDPGELSTDPHGLSPAAAAIDVAARPELRRFDAVVEELEWTRDGVRMDAMPEVSLDGRWVFTTDDGANPDNWFQASVQLTWTPIAGLARQSAAEELALAEAMLTEQREAVRRGLVVAAAQANAELETARAEIGVREQALAHADEALAIVRTQYEAGRATLTDLLDVESQRRDIANQLELARHAVVRAYLSWRHAAGLEVTLDG